MHNLNGYNEYVHIVWLKKYEYFSRPILQRRLGKIKASI